MITIRKSQDRGHAQHGWLNSYHSFSFADYYDPQWMGFRSLRVINEDFIAEGQGFGSHPHKDMEIITYVLVGQLKHKDSMGNEGIINAGEVQKMSAGTGVVHSEFNASSKKEVHLYQIWITPHTKNLPPMYQQHMLSAEQENSFVDFPVTIHQEAKILRGRVSNGRELVYELTKGNGVWVQVMEGDLILHGNGLLAGDAAIIEKEKELKFTTKNNCEFLLFDLK